MPETRCPVIYLRMKVHGSEADHDLLWPDVNECLVRLKWI